MSAKLKIFHGSDYDLQLIGTLLSPSWLSGLVAVIGSLGIIALILASLNFHGSSLQQVLDAHRTINTGVTSNFKAVDDKLSSSTLLSNIPLFIFWAAVGFIAYSFTINIYNAFSKAAHIREELEYVHADRHELIQATLVKLAVRLGVLLLWVGFLQATFRIVVPYAVAAVYYATSSIGYLNGALYLGLAFIVLVVCLHIHAVILRLIVLRPRLFGQVILPQHHEADV